MFLTTHAAAGILISQRSENDLAVFGLSFLSHFLLDFIPHGDEHLYHDHEWRLQKKYRRAILVNVADVGSLTLLIVLLSIFPGTFTGPSMLGILGAILPDFLSYLFPVIHERFSWLFVVRWMYAMTKPTGLRYLVRGQNWIHQLLHHEIIRTDISFRAGLAMQIVLTFIFLYFA